MSSIQIAGDTSGSITLSAPAVAGTNTITLPAVTGTILTTAYTGNVTFSGDLTVDTSTLYVDSTNHNISIGVNITNPAKLNLSYSNTTQPTSGQGVIQYLGNTDTSTSSVTSLFFRGMDAGGTFRHSGGISWGKSGAWTDAGNNFSGYLSFWTRPDGGESTERMRINSSGNVGIGTSSSNDILHVNKDQNASTVLRISNPNSGSIANTVLALQADGGEGTLFVASSTGGDALGLRSDSNLSGGIYIDTFAAAPIVFRTNVTERMRITSGGAVGIGTSSPGTFLDVSKDQDADTSIRVYNANSGSSARGVVLFGNNTSGAAAGIFVNSSTNTTWGGANSLNFYQGIGAPMTFLTGASERMRIDSSGNVLVGTTSQISSAKLSVNGTIGSGALIINTGSAVNVFTSYTNNGTSRWVTGLNGTETGSNVGSDLSFKNYNDAGVQISTPMTIKRSNGYVGIGTTSPLEPLHVEETNADLILKSTSDSGNSRVYFGDPSNNTIGQILYVHADNSLRTVVNNSERMRIDSSGNVGIGTSSPSSTLQVNGTCTATTFVGSLSGNATSANTATRAYEWNGSGSDSNWNTQFQDTEARSATQIDINGGTNCPTGGGWWFAESFRHSNPGNYWGLQYAHGWEDRAYQRYIRNVSGNSFGSWQLDVGARAWVNFNSWGTVSIRAGGNVSSITDNGTGDFSVNFSTAMLDANYAVTWGYGDIDANSSPINVLDLNDNRPITWATTATYARVLIAANQDNYRDPEYVSMILCR